MRFAAVLLTLSLLACQFAAKLPLPGPGGSGSPEIYAGGIDLGFDIEAAAQVPTCAGDCTELGPPLGRDGAEALAAELTPKDTVDSHEVAAETQAVIEHAQELQQEGKTDEALGLLTGRRQELQGHAGVGKHLVIPAPISGEEMRQMVADLLNLGYQAGLLSGDMTPFTEAAGSIFRDYASQELPAADLPGTLNIEADAILLGDEEIAQQAHQRALEIAERECRETSALLDDPCTVSKATVDLVLKKARTAWLMGVPSPSDKNQAFQDLMQTIGEALTAIKNRQSGNLPEGCDISGELEFAYTMYAVVGQNEPFIITTTVPFALDLKEIMPQSSTEAKVADDLDIAQGPATIRNHVGYDVTLDIYDVGGASPLPVELTINGVASATLAMPGLN